MNQIKNLPKMHSAHKAVDKYKNVPKPYMQVAEGMEAQFTNHLLNEMRKAAPSVNPESQATKIYKSLLDSERSQMMAKTNTGVGVKDVVLDQIYPQHLRKPQQQNFNNVEMYKKQQGASNE